MRRLSRACSGGGLKYAFGIGAWIGGNGLLLAPLVIRTFFGQPYEPAATALRILSVGFPVVFSLNFMNTALISMDRSKVVFASAAVGLLMNGLLNRFLIPAYAQNGAAAATIFVETILFTALSIHLRGPISFVARKMFGAVSAAAAAGAAAVLLTARWGLPAQLLAGNAVFLAVAGLLGFVEAPERAALGASLSNFLKSSRQ